MKRSAIVAVFLFLVFFLLGVAGVVLYKNYSLHIVPMPSQVAQQFSLKKPPPDALVGQIASLSGNVQWESRTATSSVSIVSPRVIQQGEALSTGDTGHAVVVFSKRALLTLFPAAAVSFVQTLPQDIVVAQDSGQVTYETQGQSPFSVRVLGLLIESKTSCTYSLAVVHSLITVVLTSGELQAAYTDAQNTSTVVSIHEGEKIQYNDATQKLTKE